MKEDFKIFIIDFDQTIAYSDYPTIISEVPNSIEVLKEIQEQGDIVILSTCREGSYLADALKWLSDKGFTPDCVNDNYPMGKHYHYGNCRKISGDVVIDDKNDNTVIDWIDIRYRHVKKHADKNNKPTQYCAIDIINKEHVYVNA